LKKKMPITNAARQKPEVATHGRKYGYISQNGEPKKLGNLSCGRESDPPMKGL
jgi:hypothetical protein